MNTIKKLIGIIIVNLFLVTSFSGCIQQQGPGSNIIIIPSVNNLYSDNPKSMMASYYSSEEITIDAQTPQYSLPLDLTTIANFNTIEDVFTLTDQQKEHLENNGVFCQRFWCRK